MLSFERPLDIMTTPSSPGSPPSLTPSKSSNSHSFHSNSSDDNSVLDDTSHFEEIGLNDDALQYTNAPLHVPKRQAPNIYSSTYATSLRTASLGHVPKPPSRDLSGRRPAQREITPTIKTRPSLPNLKPSSRLSNVRSTNTNQLLSETYLKSLPLRNQTSKPMRQMSLNFRHRSPSPNTSTTLSPKDANLSMRNRRSSWQSTRERKSATDLEKECDDDDTDDIPDSIILDNVPLSPRPPTERAKSAPASKEPSPERAPKERPRQVGNGTPAIAVAQGSLRSPSWKSDTALPTMMTINRRGPPSPLKGRSTSWTMTLAALNRDAKDLTEKLEVHAEEVELRSQRSSTGSMPGPRRVSDAADVKLRHKSAFAELPPLRRTNIMIDPLPISKEKEAVLSRTRPSWLPPKDPNEERKHVKEYQKMMLHSQENERRRDAAKRAMSECKDTAADSLMHIWEHDILPRWNDAIRERRTRDLWWRGVAPRCRGAVWSRAIGNDLGLTHSSYLAALQRARDAETRVRRGEGTVDDQKHTGWVEDIRRDIEDKTFRELKIFQLGGPLHQDLLDVLSAYAMYRSDIGYVSGCNTIAALLLLNMPSAISAFIALANVLNRPIPLSFMTSDPGAKSSVYNLLMQTLATHSKDLHTHLNSLPRHQPDDYLGAVFTALFTGHLAIDEAARLWDVYVFEGDSILVRAGVALLQDNEMALLGVKSLPEVEAVLHGRQQRAVSRPGEEERWIKAVKQAGT